MMNITMVERMPAIGGYFLWDIKRVLEHLYALYVSAPSWSCEYQIIQMRQIVHS
jgi:hypothetical protein